MILEIALLDVKPDQTSEFERAFSKAEGIVSRANGYISHELQKCLEKPNRYVLLINWQTLEDHTIGFRGSPDYEEWKALLHHFYDPFPEVEHFRLID